MHLGNRLVTEKGFGPAAGGDRDPSWKNTCLIADFAEFMNQHEEAREILKDLGFDWSMPS